MHSYSFEDDKRRGIERENGVSGPPGLEVIHDTITTITQITYF
jgi:hypothetical protein